MATTVSDSFLPALEKQRVPLRLAVAAKVAFPDGSMTAAGLRNEAKKGRLIIERIANKDYTTLDAIARMRELYRVQAKVLGSTSEKPATKERKLSAKPCGSSRTVTAISPQDALRARLKRSRQQKPSEP